MIHNTIQKGFSHLGKHVLITRRTQTGSNDTNDALEQTTLFTLGSDVECANVQVLLDLVDRRNHKGYVQHHKETEEYGNTHRIRYDAKAMANGKETQRVHAVVLPTQSPSAEVRHVNANRQERVGQSH